MPWLMPSVIATMAGTAILVFVYGYLYLTDQKKYLAVWAASWAVYFLRFVFLVCILKFGKLPVLLAANQTSSLLSGIIMLWGTTLFVEKKFSILWVYCFALGTAWIFISTFSKFSFFIMAFPTYSFLSIVYIRTGVAFIKSRDTERPERFATGCAFIIWGIHKADFPFLRPVVWFAPFGYLLAAVLEFIVAIGILLVYFRKTRNDLLRSEKVHKAMISNISDVIVIINKDGEIVYNSPNVEKWFGWKVDELIGRDGWEKVHPDDLDKVMYEFGLLLENDNDVKTIGFKLQCRDGGYKPIMLTGINLINDPVINGVLMNYHDISERQYAEDALRQEKAFTEKALNSQLDTFFLFDPTTGKAIRWNRAFCEISGYSDEEIKELSVPESYYSAEDLDQVGTFTEGVLMNGTGTIELDLICKDGRKIPTEYKVSVVNYDDEQPGYLISVGRDITKRKQAETEKKNLETQLMQAAKFEAVGTLAGGIAHDFNNILGIIIGNAELAIDDVPEWNPARGNLLEIKTASMRARDVVRQLLSFSRKSDLQKKPILIQPIVEESVTLLRATIPSTIKLTSEIIGNPGTILGDPTQIHQILINLCTNAAHAMEENGGELIITISEEWLDENTASIYLGLNSGKYVQVSVSDTGSGIPPEIKERIFDPYFTTKDVSKGTGIGLSVVKGIITNHDGAIAVSSEPGKGTRVDTMFPVIEQALTLDKSQCDALPTGNETVLFVDDEEQMIRMGRQIIERLGYSVAAFTDPLEALRTFTSQPDTFDLVMTDMTMPVMTGDRLIREIRHIRPDIPVILCTGFSEKINREISTSLGISKYIEKPMNKYELAFIIRNVLDKSK